MRVTAVLGSLIMLATVATSADVAFAHELVLDSGTRKNGVDAGIWLRSAVCCQRSDQKWLITHEHISMPVGENWSAVATLRPNPGWANR